MSARFAVIMLAAALASPRPAAGALPQGPPGRAAPKRETARPDAAQKPRRQPQGRVPTLPAVVVTAFRRPEDPFEMARSVIRLDATQLRRRDQGSILDALDRSIGIWIEKRTATTSDPVMRGLSGANLLALIDRDPITTFWGEGGFAGDDLYGKVEAESIEGIEVIRGPASVQYGSNALGGVIRFITRRPKLAWPEAGLAWGGRLKSSYDTVNEGKVARVDLEAALPVFRFRGGGTWRDLSDGQGGRGVGTLRPSGGEDLNFDWNSELRAGEHGETVFLNVQQVRRRNLARFYRPNERNENDRTGISLGYRSAPEDAAEGFEARGYYQRKEDRRLFVNGDFGVARWSTLSTDWSWHGASPVADGSLVAGATLRFDQGESPDDEQFTLHTTSGARKKAAPDQDWWNLGLFVEHEWEVLPWLSLTTGFRADGFYYRAQPDRFYQPPVGNPDLDRIRDWQTALTGGIGAVAKLADDWRLSASWARGFRSFAPRFGITKHGWGVLVPTGLLDPVTSDQYEVALRHRSEAVESSLVAYYTDFANFQNIVPGSFQGRQFFDFNGNKSFEPDERVFVTAGNGDAYVYGVEWEGRLDPAAVWDAAPAGLYLTGGFMWNYGSDTTNHEPLRHTHPARGLLSLGWEEPEEGRYYVEASADFVGRFTRIPPKRLKSDVGYRKDPQDPKSPLLREDGLPGYSVWDLRCGYRFADRVQLGLNVENLTNKNYRSAHSRMDAFGITARLFVELTF